MAESPERKARENDTKPKRERKKRAPLFEPPPGSPRNIEVYPGSIIERTLEERRRALLAQRPEGIFNHPPPTREERWYWRHEIHALTRDDLDRPLSSDLY